jgi:hypothetical protein
MNEFQDKFSYNFKLLFQLVKVVILQEMLMQALQIGKVELLPLGAF